MGLVAEEVWESEFGRFYSRKIIVVFMMLKIMGVVFGGWRCNQL